MAFIKTIPAAQAEGAVRDMYVRAQASAGYVPNHTKAFSLRPDVQAAWSGLLGSIRNHMDPRRYELVTLAAARALHSSYCTLAHSKVLEGLLAPGQLKAVAKDPLDAGLTPAEVAIMSFAERAVLDASSVSETDVQRLREHGLSDEEIFDVAAAAAARCFFSKLLDTLGVEPDSVYTDQLEAQVLECLTVGRSVSSEAVERL